MDLIKYRIEKKYTQTDVAILVGVSLTTYRMWEKGVTKPNETNLKKLKDFLNIK